MFLLNDVRGQEAQHSLVCSIDEDSLLQQLRDDGFRGFDRIEIHAEHQPHAAHFTDCSVLLFYLIQAPAEVMAHLANVVKQAIERLQKFDSDGASQRTSSECSPVHAGM